MNWTSRRQQLRAILAGNRCVHPISVFDPMSARIAEMLGFEVMMFAGSVGSQAVLGAPDLILITLTEFADQAYRIDRAGSLPLLVDADHGYGNALNVMRTVEELETAGVGLLTIEDTVLPRAFGQKGTHLISLDEAVGKMKAAVRARQDPALCVAGRLNAGGDIKVPELVERARAYEQTGVDALWLSGAKSHEELVGVSEATKLPLMLGGAAPGGTKLEDLAKLRVKTALQGHISIKATVQAVYNSMKALKDGTAPEAVPNVASDELMDKVMRTADYAKWTKDYLGG